MTWKELKEFCNQIDNQYLDKKVFVMRESETISNIDTDKFSEPHYIDPEYRDEGCFGESYAKEAYDDLSELERVYESDQPFIYEIV